MQTPSQIVDANINRVCEGLRVLEEYCRFVAADKRRTDELARLRKRLSREVSASERIAQLASRDTQDDMRAKETPDRRQDVYDVLVANFKRVTEGLRVLEEYSGNPVFSESRYDVYDLEKDICLTFLKKPIPKGVYVVSDSVDVLLDAVGKGVAMVQLRDKFASKADIYDRAIEFKNKCPKTDTPFIINDFLDIANLVDADGVHTGQDDISVSDQRRVMGPHKLIGRTTHSIEQGKLAEAEGADYVSVGPIWETPSKPERDGIGVEYLKIAAQELGIPYVAIGGINEENIEEIVAESPPLIGVIRALSVIEKVGARFS